ncbi:MAG: tryptophan--tRNA ligase [Alphaproteobacteria bacterium]|nr:tryptophan--tRNA ligase [Alphaproteobacteria bacterium]
MSRLFSGIQPTGNLHLGNYLGAIRHWITLQSQYESLFCIVDLHAITVPQEPEELRKHIRETAATYIACGIDPHKTTIFQQSQVAEHSELAWILQCMTPMGWLNRMTQFKEKAGKDRERAFSALFTYPVLMAADILLYKTQIVPVGDDQKQHLELARDIAGSFNQRFGVDFFPLPEPYIQGETTRVMSLRDGSKKMSKSDPSDYSRIHLTDDADTILQKIKKAKSDAVQGLSYDQDARPEASNLINLYAAFSGLSRDGVVEKYASSGFSVFKSDLAELVSEYVAPIGVEINKLLQDPPYLDQLLKKGADTASAIAQKHLSEIKQIVGLT